MSGSKIESGSNEDIERHGGKGGRYIERQGTCETWGEGFRGNEKREMELAD